ncbi:heterogeneous nuclear ribonucleoprotein A3-like isoform X2 [Hyposmocoma kahamanoa]|uniref:heterogeneous nuclear ribonucleoprotein A3-like isoform X2 n=1 Tax=Hyposmocoma kahamanoa TaxID=1477025 RepID=UPI000E6D5DE3|nr:heterogeneous nuclear ribonucleoprotein A3-like isoform X2 [Hyposmocoma kahamanoa]
MNLSILLIACAVAVCSTHAQRLSETNTDINDAQRRSGGGYGLLRPGAGNGYQGYNPGYNNPGYGGYGNYNPGYGGYNPGYGGNYPGYGQGSYGGYPGQSGYPGGYPGSYPGGYSGFRPGYTGFRPGFNNPGYNYPGSTFGYQGYRPGFNQYRPSVNGPLPGNYFGGHGDGYNDNFRLLGRKVSDESKSNDSSNNNEA